MTKNQLECIIVLSAAAIVILFGLMINTEGSALRDAVQGGLMGAGAVIAVAGLWAAGTKSRVNGAPYRHRYGGHNPIK